MPNAAEQIDAVAHVALCAIHAGVLSPARIHQLRDALASAEVFAREADAERKRKAEQPMYVAGVTGRESVLERFLFTALTELGEDYEPERYFGHYHVDAYLPHLRLALEADGCIYHACVACGYRKRDEQRRQYSDRRDTRLREEHGINVLHLWGHELRTYEDALCNVEAALARYRQSIARGRALLANPSTRQTRSAFKTQRKAIRSLNPCPDYTSH